MNEEATSLIELLDQLVPPQEPPPISMAPQTAGWAVLAAAILLGVAIALWRWLKHYRANAYRRAAIAAIEQANGDAAEIALVVRRCALAAFPRTDVAQLTGESWVLFLEATGKGVEFDAATAATLTEAPYRQESAASPAFVNTVKRWIKTHKADRATEARHPISEGTEARA
ncbi:MULTISPECIES: DUF4381 domain-containing protein [Halocynthiibacter]|uniref:DUF4381 domain-containing protein n=1 Tax=Halocynthiibacter halioticoli TaxID=2986804 RepID=A0AAE3LRJ6_9RHOB|nr:MULTISPECIES: DUF4381 domain-containing protein [Halocynthiibacter]MCV6824519.1 DUF4381 domain-containing protein [Halocynthiibacter halioticoli]MCW4057520.1 DUF4381 domain-containing protein [Halocynthiibacter sp. SDUM655004]